MVYEDFSYASTAYYFGSLIFGPYLARIEKEKEKEMWR